MFCNVVCLAGWKRLYLSKGGRLTLINSTLSSLPTYLLSLFPILARVANRLEKLQRDFLWGGIGDEFKFHLVNWHTICSLKVLGGLGVKNMIQFNRALMGTWLWRFAVGRDALWRKVVAIKYGSMRDGWCTKVVGGSFGIGVWKCIRRGRDVFVEHVRYEVGDGSKVLFWHDVWCGELPLKTLFSELFLIACGKDAWVDKMAQFCRMSCLFDLFMIGRWKRLIDFLSCYILLKLDVKERINCVGFQGAINPLK